jgi:hypothetical protein
MKLTAQRELKYGRRTVLAGEQFEASAAHGKILKLIKRAVDAPPDAPPPPEPPPPPPEAAKPVAPTYRGRALAAERIVPDAAPAEDPVTAAPRYRRRDMQAEES